MTNDSTQSPHLTHNNSSSGIDVRSHPDDTDPLEPHADSHGFLRLPPALARYGPGGRTHIRGLSMDSGKDAVLLSDHSHNTVCWQCYSVSFPLCLFYLSPSTCPSTHTKISISVRPPWQVPSQISKRRRARFQTSPTFWSSFPCWAPSVPEQEGRAHRKKRGQRAKRKLELQREVNPNKKVCFHTCTPFIYMIYRLRVHADVYTWMRCQCRFLWAFSNFLQWIWGPLPDQTMQQQRPTLTPNQRDPNHPRAY